MPHLHLTVDAVLSTTRAVRRRLDLTRPVEREVIEECVALAQQAPTSGDIQMKHFIAVTDPDQRLALAELYRRAYRAEWGETPEQHPRHGERIWESTQHFYTHLHEIPVLLVPCRELDGSRAEQTVFTWSGLFADAHMAAWSFMLAARERGLGTCMTALHLRYEEEAAAVLGIEYQHLVQTAMIPVAYTRGTTFRPVARKPVADVLHWNRW